ncbi:MAG: hypothetical protein JNJ59_27840 [Deltaproteobacteria bacterium]|nr:hypothetical protein [Deltaproteobacteria bacterium]
MADPTYIILVVLHIISAATAFAITMPVASALRRAAGQGREAKAAIAQLANRTGMFATIFGTATLATGLALIFYRGGFKAIPPTIHAAMGLVIVMLVLGQLLQRPTCARITAAVDQGDEAWAAARKRFVMGDGILQLLWVVVLVLMFIK